MNALLLFFYYFLFSSSCLKVQVYEFWLKAKGRPCLFQPFSSVPIHALWRLPSAHRLHRDTHCVQANAQGVHVSSFFLPCLCGLWTVTTVEQQSQQIRGFPPPWPLVARATFLSRQTLGLHTRGSPRKCKSLPCCVLCCCYSSGCQKGSVCRWKQVHFYPFRSVWTLNRNRAPSLWIPASKT